MTKDPTVEPDDHDVGAPAWLEELTRRALRCEPPTRAEALAVLRSASLAGGAVGRTGSPDGLAAADLLEVVAAAGRVRRRFFGRRVKMNYLVNMKSGLCGEDCGYCSQRRGSETGVLTYNWVGAEQVVHQAALAASRGAKRVCLVASGRGPSDRDVERVAGAVSTIKDELPGMEVCVCLGLLRSGQAGRLRDAGADAYNHNLNTAASNYAEICSTHTFEDRQGTVREAVSAGLSPCSGVIMGMGESDEQLVDVAFSLRELSPDSVPVNFLMPFPGTPMEGRAELTPERCLRALAMFRFVFPDVEVRMAGGREMHLRGLQSMALHLADSLFLGDYLTSEGAPGQSDLDMITDAGFVVEGMDEATLPRDRAAAAPALRRRGPGTSLPANA